MRLLLIAVTFISISIKAQQKEKKKLIPRVDTVKNSTKIQPPQREDQQKKMYKMPVAKPKDSIYSTMKARKQDTTDYKMLNSITPKKPKDTGKTK